MIFNSKEILLKNGVTALLRSPTAADAEQMIEHLKTTATETEFLLRYPEECTETPDQEAAFLESLCNSAADMMIVCCLGGKIIGSCKISFSQRLKTRHRAEIAIALNREHWGSGIGTTLLRELIDTARERGISQLELGVMEGNERAMGLYRKMGFRIAAEIPNAIRLKDGTMRKEFLMVKPL